MTQPGPSTLAGDVATGGRGRPSRHQPPGGQDAAGTSRERRRGLSRRARNAVLTAHIAASVAVLGDSAAFLAISVRARTLSEAEAHASYEILGMLSLTFGIPLSVVALITGVTLGLGTRWGVFRYPWVIAKLALLVSVMLVGGLVLSRAENAALDGTGGTGMLIAGATWDVLALLAAVTLSVFKPGRALRRRAQAGTVDTATT
jgi:hypothetical protein